MRFSFLALTAILPFSSLCFAEKSDLEFLAERSQTMAIHDRSHASSIVDYLNRKSVNSPISNFRASPETYFTCISSQAQIFVGGEYATCTVIMANTSGYIEVADAVLYGAKLGFGFSFKLGSFARFSFSGIDNLSRLNGYFVNLSSGLTLIPIGLDPQVNWITIGYPGTGAGRLTGDVGDVELLTLASFEALVGSVDILHVRTKGSIESLQLRPDVLIQLQQR